MPMNLCEKCMILLLTLFLVGTIASIITFFAIVPESILEYNALKLYKPAECYVENCQMFQGSECSRNNCENVYKMYCTYTVVSPGSYQNYSKKTYVEHNTNSFPIEQDIIAYNNTKQECYVTSGDIRSWMPSLDYIRSLIIGFSVFFAVIIVTWIVIIIVYKLRQPRNTLYPDNYNMKQVYPTQNV